MSEFGERITNIKVHNVSKDPSDADVSVTWWGSDGMSTAVLNSGTSINIIDNVDIEEGLEVRIATDGDFDWSKMGPMLHEVIKEKE